MFLSYANTPSEGVIHSPVLVNFSIIGFIIFIGIAKPIPSADVIFTEFIPKTSPFILINGPPLLPGFIVASVYIKSSIYDVLLCSSILIVLFNPLIIPDVTVL